MVTKVKKRRKKIRKRRRLKKLPKLILFIIVLLPIIIFIEKNKILDFKNNVETSIKNTLNDTIYKKKIEKEKNQKYNECLEENYSEKFYTEELKEKEDEIKNILKNYPLSLKYVDSKTGYTYLYNDDEIYYAASTIKMLDALYIYTKASEGNLNLDDKITYRKEDKVAESKGMSKHKIGDKISIRKVVEYDIKYSDNTAHSMLVNYIGFKNLQNFGKSLGAKNTLVGNDNFGRTTVNDSIIYVENLYKFINTKKELGEELLSFFIESDDNYLKIEEEDIKAATKYGLYMYNFHQNGIVFADIPYYISILSLNAKGKYSDMFKKINKEIYELHKYYYETRMNVCHKEIYENN